MAKTYVASPMSRLDIRNMAKKFRELLGIQNDLYVDVLRILEMLLPSMGVNYEIVKNSELNTEAITIPGENLIKIREDVYLGARKGVGRYRFTIMHEIAHLILHDYSTIRLARGDEKPVAYLDPEWQADAFAGEFLVPYNLTKNMTEAEIVKYCRVTPKAAQCQIKKQRR